MRDETRKALAAWVHAVINGSTNLNWAMKGAALLRELEIEGFVPDCADPDGSITRHRAKLEALTAPSVLDNTANR